jgi:hypothetical protein
MANSYTTPSSLHFNVKRFEEDLRRSHLAETVSRFHSGAIADCNQETQPGLNDFRHRSANPEDVVDREEQA